jgi:hypothetical protein
MLSSVLSCWGNASPEQVETVGFRGRVLINVPMTVWSAIAGALQQRTSLLSRLLFAGIECMRATLSVMARFYAARPEGGLRPIVMWRSTP